MYVDREMSIPEISKETGLAQSRVRRFLLSKNVLRSRADSVRIAAKQGKLSKSKGRKRTFTEEHIKKIGEARRKWAKEHAKGKSLKATGYVVFTNGEHKHRPEHAVIMENIIGRRLFSNEVVHHIDGNKSNNDPSNLRLMTNREHNRLHAKENVNKRTRNEHGQFK